MQTACAPYWLAVQRWMLHESASRETDAEKLFFVVGWNHDGKHVMPQGLLSDGTPRHAGVRVSSALLLPDHSDAVP